MQRKATANLLKWKESKDRKPLMMHGIRQVGKSWLMKDFGARYYKNAAYVDFDNNPRAKAIFNNGFDAKRIIRELEIETNTKIIPGETLIILDEIQACKQAQASLKYFCEKANKHHVMAASNLLGAIDNTDNTDRITIYPMTFLEFLTAIEEERFVKLIQDADFKTISTFSEKIFSLMKLYFYVGGLPAAVKKYANTRFLPDVQNVLHGLANDYYADFAKYAPEEIVARVRKIWNSIPLQLGKKNKRFLYAALRKGSRGRNYKTALQWLLDAGMAHKICRVNQPDMPLKACEDGSVFKLYMPDIGLLSALTALDLHAYLESGNAIFNHCKGVLAEQFVLQELLANKGLPLYFWANETNRAEIEFVLQLNGKIIPVDVKIGKNFKSESLRAYIAKEGFAAEMAVKSSLLNYEAVNNAYGTNCVLYNIPLYAVGTFEP
jgi:predicted AAA+ superfamily ATPase